MDLVTAGQTRSFLEAAWKKFDAGNEKIYNRHISALEPPASHARVHEQVRSRSSLPIIDLPKFSGSITYWRPFEDLFFSLVKDNQDILQVEKMHYLRSSLEGGKAAGSPSYEDKDIDRHKTHEEQQTSPQPAKPQTSHRQAVTSQTSQGQSLPFIQDLSNNCCYCRRQHYLAFAPQFASLSRKDRVEVVMEARLCFNCLGRHNVRQCRSKRRCNFCGEQHHTLIHQEHRAISTKPKASQVRSKSSSPISNTTMSFQRLPHQPARQKSPRRRLSHQQSSHSRSSSSSTPSASPTPSFRQKSSPTPPSPRQKSSPSSSSHQKLPPPPSSHKLDPPSSSHRSPSRSFSKTKAPSN
ncbi:hypothetical protein M0802_012133 [Mischocyttarus mexicanus]|nr:hypothetical protein M0802_012133 [Mischocyttarus mexicanus]